MIRSDPLPDRPRSMFVIVVVMMIEVDFSAVGLVVDFDSEVGGGSLGVENVDEFFILEEEAAGFALGVPLRGSGGDLELLGLGSGFEVQEELWFFDGDDFFGGAVEDVDDDFVGFVLDDEFGVEFFITEFDERSTVGAFRGVVVIVGSRETGNADERENDGGHERQRATNPCACEHDFPLTLRGEFFQAAENRDSQPGARLCFESDRFEGEAVTMRKQNPKGIGCGRLGRKNQISQRESRARRDRPESGIGGDSQRENAPVRFEEQSVSGAGDNRET